MCQRWRAIRSQFAMQSRSYYDCHEFEAKVQAKTIEISVPDSRFPVPRSSFFFPRSPFSVLRSLFSVPRFPFLVHRSSFSVLRSPYSAPRTPFYIFRSMYSRFTFRSSFFVSRSLFLIFAPRSPYSVPRTSFPVLRSPYSFPRTPFPVPRSPFLVFLPRSNFTVPCSSFLEFGCSPSLVGVASCNCRGHFKQRFLKHLSAMSVLIGKKNHLILRFTLDRKTFQTGLDPSEFTSELLRILAVIRVQQNKQEKENATVFPK